jgi:hypothetical protein
VRSYDARFPVFAAWALEFAPVNVSVVLVQPHREDFLCVGSRSWFFQSLPDCVAEVQSRYPWRVGKHVLPFEKPPGVWDALYNDLCVYNLVHAPQMEDGRRMLITQAFLSRLTIDTSPRPWDAESNQLLVDSLNGYRMREVQSVQDQFTQTVAATFEQYLARALENFAAYEWREPARGARAWGPAPNYAAHDKAVIAGGRRGG